MKAASRYDTTIAAAQREAAENWDALTRAPQFFPLKRGWEIAVIPPFAGAAARFLVRKGKAQVSVYLDATEALGYYGGEVYWELYPLDGDTFRCGYEEIDRLTSAIEKALKQQTRQA